MTSGRTRGSADRSSASENSPVRRSHRSSAPTAVPLAQILFLPFTWLITGRWSPRKAKQDAEAVNRELAALASADGAERTPA